MGLSISTASSMMPISCYKDEPPVISPSTPSSGVVPKYDERDDIILPDTVSQAILQDITNVHERIDAIFQSLGIIKQENSINDIKSIEFEDANNNKYNLSVIKQIDDGFELYGTVTHTNGFQEDGFIRFSDGKKFIDRPLVCLETSFNKIHNLSMIYQSQWRLGKDGNPERRLFQNRTNQDVDSIRRDEYYPYDMDNVFVLRRKDNVISSKKVLDKGRNFSDDDEIKNISVLYK